MINFAVRQTSSGLLGIPTYLFTMNSQDVISIAFYFDGDIIHNKNTLTTDTLQKRVNAAK